MSLCRFGIAALCVCLLTLSGCTSKEDTPEVAEKVVWPVLLVELSEVNRDSFDEPLMIHRPGDGLVPFTLDNGVVHLDAAVLDTSDPEVLAQYHLTLDSKSTPLKDCGVLVLRSLKFVGVGRTESRTDYFAFKELPVNVEPVALTREVTDTLEVDPGSSSIPQASLSVRFPGDMTALTLESVESGSSLLVKRGSDFWNVVAGDSIIVHEEKRSVRISQEALTVASLDFDGDEDIVLDDPNEIVLPAEDYGSVRFSTRLELRFHGELPALLDTVEEDRR